MFKIYTRKLCWPTGRIPNILLIMKLIVLIMIVTLMQVSAASFGQKITLNRERVSLKEVFSEIRRQSGYDVFMSSDGVKLSTKINVDVVGLSVEKAVEKILEGLPLTYMLDGNTIVIKEKERSIVDRLVDYFASIDVTGKLVDENRQPIAGATIKVKGSTIATVSDGNGVFLLRNVADDAVLEISYLGYQIKEVKAAKDLGFLRMELAIGKLSEVTVNAGYYTVKDRDRTGSISRISSKHIETQPVSNPLAAMYGMISGVNITQSTGTPGGGFSIQIRGVNSLMANGNEPLYVIDGVPYGSQSLGNAQLTNGVLPTQTSPLNSINTSDIESIEVLKDADATAIYGSRGANGVILITTKKGKAGKSRFSLQTSTTVGKITKKLDLLNTEQYLAMRRKAFENDKLIQYPQTDYDINGTWDQTRNTDWQKELIGANAYINNMQLSISGGNTETQYLMSGTWRDETDTFPGDGRFTKGAVHTSITHRSPDEKFKFQLSADYSIDKNTLPGADLTRQAYVISPNAPALYDENKKLNWENGTFENPLSFLEETYSTNTPNLISNLSLSYKLGRGFELKSSFGYTDLRLTENRVRPSTRYNPIYDATSANSSLMLNKGTRQSWIIEPQLNWEHKWKTAEISILAGATLQNQKQETLALEGYGFSSNNVINSLAAAKTISVITNDISEYRYNAIFGRLNLNWAGKYILNLTARRDGSSRFGPNKQFANFGALGAAWIFSKEKLLENNPIVSFGKLRSSYGITGNDQIGDYQYLDTYTVTTNVYDGITGLAPARLFNPDFGWETNKKLEVAIELGFLDDRIFLTAATFLNRSGNQLVGIPLPGTAGFANLQANLDAKVQNKGFEFDLRTENIKTKKFNWVTTINLSLLRNKLLEFPGLKGSTYQNTFVIGQPLNIRKVYHLTGVNDQTGVYTFIDYNNDGVISSNEDRQIIVNTTMPKYFGGLSSQFSYKHWSFDFLLQFVKQKGSDVLASFPITGAASNQPQSVLNNGPGLRVQQYTTGKNPSAVTAYSNFTRSDAMIVDASFIRLKSILLSYSLPAIGKTPLSGRIYIQGQNLLTFTGYNGPDPENQSGVYLPPLRQLTLGLQFSF